MKRFKVFAVATVAALCLALSAPRADAQLSINVNFGQQPVCPYGYFDYSPYRCAPFGYYGPQWFSGGLFIGAGPWFRGPVGFHGYVDHRYDPRFGYRGGFPRRGERADWGRHRGWEHSFHGTDMRQEQRHDNGRHNGENRAHGNHYAQRGHGKEQKKHGPDRHDHHNHD
ncbi:MAG TPA: hypothetical protein VND90_00425 [Terracidiphilus sp.]|nr:hypothetical protein [Terracidiphilus sp.]